MIGIKFVPCDSVSFKVGWMKKSQSLHLDCLRGESQRTYMEIQYLFQLSHKCLNILKKCSKVSQSDSQVSQSVSQVSQGPYG